MDNKINQWLQQFEIVQEISRYEEIHSQYVTDEVKNLAMQRTGWTNLPKKYVTDKCSYRQYQYMLLLKSESESDIQRLDNYDWLDELSYLLDKANRDRKFPILDDGKIYEISCANSYTIQDSEDGSQSVYSLEIYVNVKGGQI